MVWRPHGRARVDARNPRAFAICDRCGLLYNQVMLKFQYDWRGNQIVNTNTLVCDICYDVPYEGRRPLKLPPDPMPISNPRPVRYALDAENIPPIHRWDEPGLMFDDGQTDWEQ